MDIIIIILVVDIILSLPKRVKKILHLENRLTAKTTFVRLSICPGSETETPRFSHIISLDVIADRNFVPPPASDQKKWLKLRLGTFGTDC